MESGRVAVTEEPARHRRFRASRRVVILGLAGLLFLAALAAVMGSVTGSARDELHAVADRVLPASEHLAAANELLDRSHFAFVQAMNGPAADRPAGIASAQELQRRADGEWEAYRRLGPFPPAERALQADYVAAGARANSAATSALALVDSADRTGYEAAMATERDLHADRLTLAATIRRRFYEPSLRDGVEQTRDALGDVDRAGLVFVAVTALLIVVAGAIAFRRYGRMERERAARVAERREHDRLSELEVQLRRGLEMEPSEEGTYEVIEAALHVVRADRPTELLLADSSGTHFRRVVRTGGDEPGASCQVPSPHECPVTTRGDTRVFPASDRVDVCPFLRNREGPVISAVCVPIGIAGTATGVIHAVGPAGTPPADQVVTELELVAREAGERIGFLRVLARTEAQAETDPLTGLWNRRTVEHRVAELLDHDVSFVVAYADLDHFKQINDTHGHDVGDRALRLFARVLRDSVRPNDLPARYGGEEFVVVLPACSLGDAGIVAERVRTELADSLVAARVPPFTMSVGLARHEPGEDFDATVIRADNAMRLAKSRGRDRVVSTEDIARGADDADDADDASR